MSSDFSALLCVYHKNTLLEVQEALLSTVEQQNKPPNELVVVFDGPVADDIKDLIQKYSQKIQTNVVQLKVNRGHGMARARGINECQFDWVAMVDADDISAPNRFELLCEQISLYPELAVVGGAFTEFTEIGGVKTMGSLRSLPKNHSDVVRYARTRSPVAQPTCMVRRSAVLNVGNYQHWFNNEDYHLWLRLISSGYKFYNIQDPVLLMRTDPDTYTRRGGFRYWWSETRLQLFSLKQGTTSPVLFLLGTGFRFFVQIITPNSLRKTVYKKLMRR